MGNSFSLDYTLQSIKFTESFKDFSSNSVSDVSIYGLLVQVSFIFISFILNDLYNLCWR